MCLQSLFNCLLGFPNPWEDLLIATDKMSKLSHDNLLPNLSQKFHIEQQENQASSLVLHHIIIESNECDLQPPGQTWLK